MQSKWLWIAFAAALTLVAIACKGGGFSAEPSGHITFVSAREGDSEIYVMNGDGSSPVNVSNDPAEDFEPWWSPDGSRIAFTSYRAGSPNIFTMAADGSDVKQLNDNPAVDGGSHWSPDGTRIAIYTFRQPQDGSLWVMGDDGSDLHPILKGMLLSPETPCSGGFAAGWFPDGERMLFRGSQGSLHALQICSVKEDGSDIRVILSEENVKSYFPALSPDGKKIAFTSDRDGNSEIYVMNTDGGGIKRITNDDALDEYPTWSPDGQWLAFHSERDGDFDIYIVRPDGSDVRLLTDNDINDEQPSWGP